MKKKKLNSKNPKYLLDNKPIEKKRVLCCITKNKVKVYAVWY
jgi:hypothetical protein